MKTRLLALLFFAWTFALIGKSANATEILFEEHTIHTASLAWASQLSYPADIDGDGDIDVVASTRMSGGPVWWFENSGGSDPTFILHLVDNTGVTRSVFAADMDGDGDTDLLTGSSADGSGNLRWYENDGMNPPTFTRHVVPSVGNNFYTITAADIDGDGDIDIAAHSGFVFQNDDHTSWFENQGGSPPTFVERPLQTGADMSHSIRTADLDGDGDLDILLGDLAQENGKVVWYEQIDAAQTIFVLRNVGATGGNAIVNPADVDGDGDVDILVANYLGPDGEFFWYENDGGSPPTFQENAVWDNVITPATAFPADIDGDSDIDVLGAYSLSLTSPRSGQFVWYESDGGLTPSFSEHIIAVTPDNVQATWVTAADFNADGVPDVLGQEGSTTSLSRILWYETELPQIPVQEITIDIKPGNKPNVINPRARGGIWVAILSDTDLLSPFDPSL